MSDTAVVLKYIGDGAFFPNVPARDLTKADLEAIKDLGWNEGNLTRSGLYENVGKASKPQKKDNK